MREREGRERENKNEESKKRAERDRLSGTVDRDTERERGWTKDRTALLGKRRQAVDERESSVSLSLTSSAEAVLFHSILHLSQILQGRTLRRP